MDLSYTYLELGFNVFDPDAIDEGIDSLAREQAQRILNEAS